MVVAATALPVIEEVYQDPADQKVDGEAYTKLANLLGGCHHGIGDGLYIDGQIVVPERREELIADLEKRIGVKVQNVEIGHVDFLKDAAFIKVYYNLAKGESNTVNTVTKAKNYVG